MAPNPLPHKATAAEMDRSIAGLARRQHGVWSRRQAIAAHATRSMIGTRIRRGVWVRFDTAVFGHLASDPTWERSVMAAVLAEPWAVASHRSAAVLHGLEGIRKGRPEVTIRAGANARGSLAIAHRGVDVRTTTIARIPTVTLEQCFVDLAQVISERRVRTALAARADVRPDVLDAVRDRYCDLAPRGGRDLRPLRAVLRRFGTGALPTISALEHQLRRVLDGPGIPPVEWEAPFPGREPSARRVDALIPAWSIVIEALCGTGEAKVHAEALGRRSSPN